MRTTQIGPDLSLKGRGGGVREIENKGYSILPTLNMLLLYYSMQLSMIMKPMWRNNVLKNYKFIV